MRLVLGLVVAAVTAASAPASLAPTTAVPTSATASTASSRPLPLSPRTAAPGQTVTAVGRRAVGFGCVVWYGPTLAADATCRVDDGQAQVRSLVAAVRDGCVYQLASGRSVLTATLFLDEVALPSYTRSLDLTVAVALDPPLLLAPAAAVRLPDAAEAARG